MYIIPLSYQDHARVNEYEKTFGQSLPEWVVTLDREESRNLLGLCIKLRWKLPYEVLMRGEANQGKGILWDEQLTTWDHKVDKPKKPKYKKR